MNMDIKSLIQSRTQPVQKTKITNERQVVLGDFLEKLNQDRGVYKPLTAARLGMMMRHMSTSEMKTFYGELKSCQSFSKSFWYKMNKKNYV